MPDVSTLRSDTDANSPCVARQQLNRPDKRSAIHEYMTRAMDRNRGEAL